MSIWLLIALQCPVTDEVGPSSGQADPSTCKYLFVADGEAACPATNPGTWVTPADYPPSSLRNAEVGTVGFRLEVGVDGRATDCTVTGPTPYPTLNETTCRLLLERARFVPPQADGESGVADRYRSSVRWEIPDANDNAILIMPYGIDARLTFGPAGHVIDCEPIALDFTSAETLGGTPPTAEQYCANMRANAFVPVRAEDRDNFPQTYRVRQSVVREPATE